MWQGNRLAMTPPLLDTSGTLTISDSSQSPPLSIPATIKVSPVVPEEALYLSVLQRVLAMDKFGAALAAEGRDGTELSRVPTVFMSSQVGVQATLRLFLLQLLPLAPYRLDREMATSIFQHCCPGQGKPGERFAERIGIGGGDPYFWGAGLLVGL
jgi:hypothetical protein